VLRYNPFEAGKFRTVEGARGVFYTASVSSDGRHLGRVFAQLRQRDGDDTVLLAASGDQQVDAASGERQIVLHDGWRYTGVPGQARFDVVQFKTLTLRAEPPPFVYVNSQRQLATTAALLARATPADLAELSGRLAAPLSVLVLALLAVPLSRLRPRQGRYTKVVLGVLVYLAYANLTGLSQHWIEKGRMSLLVGAGWVHLLALALALLLILHETGWRLRRQNGSPT
jgi:Predicted permeases